MPIFTFRADLNIEAKRFDLVTTAHRFDLCAAVERFDTNACPKRFDLRSDPTRVPIDFEVPPDERLTWDGVPIVDRGEYLVDQE